MKSVFILILLAISSEVFAGKFITGIGYLHPERYRRDNELNPLPFGLSFIPMLAYRGERLQVLGPRASYKVINGFFRVSANLNIGGDNYKANILKERETALHAGFSLGLPFLTFRYEKDVSGTHKGFLYRISLGHMQQVTSKFRVIARISHEYVSNKFARYYYSVSANEAGIFNQYDLGSEQNIIVSLNMSYAFNETHSVMFSWNHNRFGKDIANSPTIRLKNYNTFGLFWNYTI